MTTKNFQKYLEQRLSKSEIREIEHQVKLEQDALYSLQNDITKAIDVYMEKENIGFNELVRRLDISPTHAAKIQRGEANLTLGTIAHIFTLLGQKPHLVFV